jgi:hypothetical protein
VSEERRYEKIELSRLFSAAAPKNRLIFHLGVSARRTPFLPALFFARDRKSRYLVTGYYHRLHFVRSVIARRCFRS